MLGSCLAHVVFLFLFIWFCDLDLELSMPLFSFWFRKSCKLGCFHACYTSVNGDYPLGKHVFSKNPNQRMAFERSSLGINRNEALFWFHKYFNHVIIFTGVIDQLPNLLEIWCDPKANNTMFCKDSFPPQIHLIPLSLVACFTIMIHASNHVITY